MFETPILLITFNRPNHTRRVWNEIKKQKPAQVFVFQDGVRNEFEADKEKCSAVRAVFDEPLDWDCELKTFYSDINLGCGRGPATAITWFFDNVEKGIIMEDDCLPHPDFFQFCDDMLNMYQDETSVMVVGTTTYRDDYPCKDSYTFSKYFTGGAWATWKRAWRGFSFDLQEISLKSFRKLIKKQFYSPAETNWWVRKVKEIQNDVGEKSYWDYQMQIHLLNNNGLAIRPQKNMISNIGFDSAGTHTQQNDGRGNRQVFGCYPIVHPSQIVVNKQHDYLYMAKEHEKSMNKMLISAIYRYMQESGGISNKVLKLYKSAKKTWKKN